MELKTRETSTQAGEPTPAIPEWFLTWRDGSTASHHETSEAGQLGARSVVISNFRLRRLQNHDPPLPHPGQAQSG
jgi:hypothetical protein